MRLFEIGEVYRRIDAAIDEAGGEILPEVETALAAMDVLESEKVDAIACLIREAEAEEQAFRDEATIFTEKARLAEKKADRLKAYLLEHLKGRNLDKIKANRFTVRRGRSSTPTIRWVGDTPIPRDFARVKVELDSAKARAANAAGKLPANFEVSWTEFVSIR